MDLASLANAPSLSRPSTSKDTPSITKPLFPVPASLLRPLRKPRSLGNRIKQKSQSPVDTLFEGGGDRHSQDSIKDAGNNRDLAISPPCGGSAADTVQKDEAKTPGLLIAQNEVQEKDTKFAVNEFSENLGLETLNIDSYNNSQLVRKQGELPARQTPCIQKNAGNADEGTSIYGNARIGTHIHESAVSRASHNTCAQGQPSGIDNRNKEKKDDIWEDMTNVLLMLPDEPENGLRKETRNIALMHSRRESEIELRKETNITAVTQGISGRESPDFGEYQPSCLSSGRRSPIAGRRRGPSDRVSCRDVETPQLNLMEGKDAAAHASSSTQQTGTDIDLQERAVRSDKCENEKTCLVRRKFAQDSVQSPSSTKTGNEEEIRKISDEMSAMSTMSWSKARRDASTDRDIENGPLFERLRQALVEKEKIENEKASLHGEVQKLKGENNSLQEEVQKLEEDKLKLQKELSEGELSKYSVILNQFSEDKDEAERLALQVASEVQHLKSTCMLAEDKLSSLQKIYQQEVEMLKSIHAHELEMKEKQINDERAFVADNAQMMEKLSGLVVNANEWSVKVERIQGELISERQTSNDARTEWLEALKESIDKQRISMSTWGKESERSHEKLEEIFELLSTGVRDIKDMHATDKETLSKERGRLQALQDDLQAERAQSLADITAAWKKLEEIRNACVQEKEEFCNKCLEERRELAAERDAVLRMKEQVYQADAALEKQLLEHTSWIQHETTELTRQSAELERAKAIAADIAREVEDGRQQLERQWQASERDLLRDTQREGKKEFLQFRKKHKHGLETCQLQERRRRLAAASHMLRETVINQGLSTSGRKARGIFGTRLRNEEAGCSKQVTSNFGEDKDASYLQYQEEFLAEARRNLQATRLSNELLLKH